MILRSLLIASACFGSFLLGACATDLGVKVYRSKVDKGGLYRKQANELVLYKDSDGFYCTDESGIRKLTEAYKSCKDLCQSPN